MRCILLAIGLFFFTSVIVMIFLKSNNNDNAIKPSPDFTLSPGLPLASPTQTTPFASNPLPKNSMNIDKNNKYTAVLHTTVGDITIELNVLQTPITVNNFVSLSKKNFYNNTIFHRVIKGFMIQGGDPNGDGTGGPGYTFNDELFTGEYTRGTVAMANRGPNTNGSQFFIMQQNMDLPKNYVIFGKVSDGMDTVDKIAEAAVTINGQEESRPINPVKIGSVEIIEQ